ncbi:MAG: hypothetical protein LBJ11_05800 [Oscillospiraceae bacterium]|jgi:capsular polysaccharide biosynthesis protein|nr:hypothetical protein [Oscillospiraceae bacterium]
MCDTIKKILKVVAIIVAIAAAGAAVYVVVKKVLDKKKAKAEDLESYVACSCLDDEPIPVEEN